ncbi:hypothetical protein ACT1U9_31485 [Streptomyces sp. BR1]|uniref:hypothetical protein n=1 Tax=Streptomyces sp. BR1 TaxID=1592323 RepID=UPI00402B611F
MGLVLFPGDGNNDSPDISWSYTGFGMFRKWLAQTEGFTLHEMRGFGGQRPWSEATTTLTPLLDHPDDAGELTPAQCAAILPRIREIAEQQPYEDHLDPVQQRRIDDVRQLLVVLRLCIDKDVDLLFG